MSESARIDDSGGELCRSHIRGICVSESLRAVEAPGTKILLERADPLEDRMMNGRERIITKSVPCNLSVGDVQKRSGKHVIVVRR